MRFKALYQGPQIADGHPYEDKTAATPCSHFSTWSATGLYAIDVEDQPWLLASHGCKGHLRWMSMAEFIKGPQ